MANIGELPYGVLGTAPKFGSAKKLNLSLCLRPLKQRRKRKFFAVVFLQVVKKKRAGHAKFFVFSFTYWAHCRRRHRALRCCSQDLSTCVNR